MGERAVVYVVKGYPRRSELFITSEIWRMEQLGVRIHLVVLTPSDETERHAVTADIRARPWYLPTMTSLSSTTARRWLRANLPEYRPALGRTIRRHPLRFARVAAMAAAQAVRARQGWRPRKVYLKELLQAVAVADRVEALGDAGHLHAHFAHGCTTVTWLAAHLTALPFSFTGHAKDIYLESLNPAGLLERKLRAAAFAVTCTAANVDHLRARAGGTPVHLVYHGLNPELTDLLATPAPVARGGRFRIVSVGRLVEKKGFDVLVDAVAAAVERGLDVELVVAGEDGPARHDVEAAVARHGLGDRVTVSGPVDQPGLLALLRSADVFALACRVASDGDRDGIPNVLVEAMAAGTPVVSTRVSGIAELVDDGTNGVLVEPDDAAALAEAIVALSDDPCTRARLAAAGSQTVARRFDGDELARELAALLAVAP
jgi:glycosyltransferase involved in cell wall biosynthesis